MKNNIEIIENGLNYSTNFDGDSEIYFTFKLKTEDGKITTSLKVYVGKVEQDFKPISSLDDIEHIHRVEWIQKLLYSEDEIIEMINQAVKIETEKAIKSQSENFNNIAKERDEMIKLLTKKLHNNQELTNHEQTEYDILVHFGYMERIKKESDD